MAETSNKGFVSARYGGGNGNGLNYRVYGKGFNRGAEYHSMARTTIAGAPRKAAFAWTGSRISATPSLCKEIFTMRARAKPFQLTNYAPPYSQIVTGTDVFPAETF